MLKIPLDPISHHSTAVAAIGYDAPTRTLAIQFHSGRIFHYPDIELDTKDRLMAASSVGRAYAQFAKEHGPGSRVTYSCPNCQSEGYRGDICDDCGTAVHGQQIIVGGGR